MKRIVAIQMDPVESIHPHTDSSVLLGMEATRRGYDVYCYLAQDLTLANRAITARARPVIFRNNPEDYFTAGEYQTIDLRTADVVLMRQDPPFDMAYITATYLLEMLQPKTLVVNDPLHVRNVPEKLFMFHFPEFIPPTLITRDIKAIENFWDEHKDIVLKPVYGYAGHSVYHITPSDTGLHARVDAFLTGSNEPIIAQRFLQEIKEMDKRIIVIDGKVSCVMGRVPAEGDFRANFRVGGTGKRVEPSTRDLLIGETVGKELVERGILFAGLDVIGDYLTEINVTSPTALPRSNEIYGIHQERLVWDAIEKRLPTQ